VPISGDLYKQLGRSAAGSVCIVAAYDRITDVIVGLTASSFVTLSFNPPMVMFALQQNADSYATIVSSKAFGVSLLSSAQSATASIFARKGREKAQSMTFASGQVLHVPLIPDSLAHIECLTSQILLCWRRVLSRPMRKTRAPCFSSTPACRASSEAATSTNSA
jgi:flavin reductase ActVB